MRHFAVLALIALLPSTSAPAPYSLNGPQERVFEGTLLSQGLVCDEDLPSKDLLL